MNQTTLGTTLFEREALSQLGALERFAYHLCRDRHDARDLVQETLLKAFTHFPSYREGTDCRAWLFRICRNSFLNEYRRKSRQDVLVDFQDDGAEHGGDGDCVDGHAARVSLQDTSGPEAVENGFSDELFQALQTLPTAYQTAVILCDVEDQSYLEIAELMKVPVGTVRSRIHRGRRILASQLTRTTP